MKVYIKVINEQVSENIKVSLIMDDDGMKYVVHDRRLSAEPQERVLGVEIPAVCRREIMRRFIPNVDGKTGVLRKDTVISPHLDDFIYQCWNVILDTEPQLSDI